MQKAKMLHLFGQKKRLIPRFVHYRGVFPHKLGCEAVTRIYDSRDQSHESRGICANSIGTITSFPICAISNDTIALISLGNSR